MYLKYPHKTATFNGNTVPVPYVPKEEISDHRHALPYTQWKAIVACYLKNLVAYLLTGKAFKLPGMGALQLRKWKQTRNRPVNFKATKEKYGEINKTLPRGQRKKVFHMNHHSKGYKPIFIWYKMGARFRHKWLWKFKLTRANWGTISEALLSDMTLINKLHQK